MRFYTRKRRPPPAVIIVALIDVLIVVLIFLMVTTTFKKPQPSLHLALPESSQAMKAGASDSPPMIVYIEETGNLRFGPEATPVTLDGLKERLTTEAAKNPELRVAISADKKAPTGQFIRVMDVCKEVKLKAVNAFVKPSALP